MDTTRPGALMSDRLEGWETFAATLTTFLEAQSDEAQVLFDTPFMRNPATKESVSPRDWVRHAYREGWVTGFRTRAEQTPAGGAEDCRGVGVCQGCGAVLTHAGKAP